MSPVPPAAANRHPQRYQHPFLGSGNPRAGNGDLQLPNQKPQNPAHAKLQRNQHSPADGGSPCGLGNTQHPAAPTTLQRPTASFKPPGAELHRLRYHPAWRPWPHGTSGSSSPAFSILPLPIVCRSPALTLGIYNPPFRRGIVCRQPRRATRVLDEPGLDFSFPRFPVYGAREEPVLATPRRPL